MDVYIEAYIIRDTGAWFGVVHLGDKCSMVRAAIDKRSSPVERVYLVAMISLSKLRFWPKSFI